jgi:hypothetical protein
MIKEYTSLRMVIVYLLLMAIAKIYLKLPYWGVLLIAVPLKIRRE